MVHGGDSTVNGFSMISKLWKIYIEYVLKLKYKKKKKKMKKTRTNSIIF